MKGIKWLIPYLQIKGTVVTHQTLCKLQKSDLVWDYEKRKINLLDDVIKKKIGISVSYPEKPIPAIYTPYEDNSAENPTYLPDNFNPVESDGTATFEKPITYNLIHFEVKLP